MSRYVSVLTEKINILSGQFSHKELEIDQLRTYVLFFLFYRVLVFLSFRLLLTTTNQLKQSNAANVALKAKLKSTKEALQKSENEIREKDKKYARLFRYDVYFEKKQIHYFLLISSDYNRLDACAGFLKYRLAEITTEKETVEGLLKERQGAAESLRKQSEEEQKAFKSLQKSSDFCIEDRSRLQNFVSKQSKFLKKWENYLKTWYVILKFLLKYSYFYYRLLFTL